MPIALKPGGSREYVLECERPRKDDDGKTVVPVERPTVFMLRNLTLAERELVLEQLKGALEGNPTDLRSVKVNFGKAAVVLQVGLSGWRHFPTPSDGDLQYATEEWTDPAGVSRQAVKRDLIDYLQTDHVMELANAIADQNQLTESDLGNSEKSD